MTAPFTTTALIEFLDEQIAKRLFGRDQVTVDKLHAIRDWMLDPPVEGDGWPCEERHAPDVIEWDRDERPVVRVGSLIVIADLTDKRGAKGQIYQVEDGDLKHRRDLEAQRDKAAANRKAARAGHPAQKKAGDHAEA